MEAEHGEGGCLRRSTHYMLVVVRRGMQSGMDGAEGCSHPGALGAIRCLCAREEPGEPIVERDGGGQHPALADRRVIGDRQGDAG